MRDDIEAIAADLTRAAGRPIVDLRTAGELLGVSVSTLRQAVYRGALRVSRAARNAPCRVACREIARYHVEGLGRSLPETTLEEREARAARLARSRP